MKDPYEPESGGGKLRHDNLACTVNNSEAVEACTAFG